ncbi:unnamed protein product [Penicillium bialowiezense]
MKFSVPSLALLVFVAPALAQVVPGSVDINYHSGYDRYQGRGGECTTSKAPEKDVTSINISAFAPGPVTCDFYTFVAYYPKLRSKLIRPGERTVMETSTVSQLREESRGNSSASHSKLVA